jgi:DsbC/DsbD-like thiol-disulfide interchange protein
MVRHALIAALSLAAAQAAAEPPRAEAGLLLGWATQDGGRVAGLWIRMAPGWKTYWRSPGEAGVPPRFDWTGSDNLAGATVEWPAPHAFDSYGMTTLGYAGELVLPLALRPEDPLRPMTVRLALEYGVCADICVPERVDLAMTIAPGAGEEGAARIAAAQAAAPLRAADIGASASCALRGAGSERVFQASIAMPAALASAPVLAVEGPDGVWFSGVEARLGDTPSQVVATADAYVEDPATWVGRDAMRLTLVGPDSAIEFDGCAATAD